MKTKLFIEQHFHGCYGVNFNTASVEDVLYLAQKILQEGVGYIFPTLVTDSIENTRRQIKIIKQASEKQTSDMAQICGVHLEGIFLNPEKKEFMILTILWCLLLIILKSWMMIL